MLTFYYGLCMDPAVRERAGAGGGLGERARLDGYALVIGRCATLVESAGAAVYGMLVEQSERDLALLYPPATHGAYRPQRVQPRALADGGSRLGTTWIAPLEAVGTCDPGVAQALAELLEGLAFPPECIAALRMQRSGRSYVTSAAPVLAAARGRA